MKTVVPRARRLGTRALVTSGVPAAADRVLVRAGSRRAPRAPRTHLVLAAPGSGNIGDQALLEALLENCGGPTTLVVSGTEPPRLPAGPADRVDCLLLPDLVYGTGAAHRTAAARFGRELAGAAHLSVIGADVMDGRYSLPASVRRASLAAVAARSGVDTRVVGFSWSDRARLGARRALTAAGRAGVRLLARDPVSAQRLRAAGVPGVEDAADVVFAARTTDDGPAREFLAGVTAPVALVNVSGLLAARLDQTADYVRVVEALRAQGLHVLLLPHVSRPTGDDVLACARVAERTGADVVDRLLEPAQVRGLTARAAVTVTGRMHLAVMSLLHGVPAVTLATQGKVEGLMRLVGVPELCVEPRPGFADDVVATLHDVLPAGSPARAAIAAALPGVVELARRNLAGLPAPVPAGEPR